MAAEAPANTPDAWSELAAAAEPWTAAGWSERGQTQRFLAVLRHLEPRPGESVLDFGSGPGRLAAFLPAGVDYFAHDWAPGMLARVAADHPGASTLAELPDRRFDHVVAVGPFNLTDGSSKLQTWERLAELWLNYTRQTLIVSLYRGDDERCLRYSPGELVWLANWLGCSSFLVDATYLPNDLLLVMRR